MMPTDACLFFYDCEGCGAPLKPKRDDCCVFCSYGSVPCPPVQASGADYLVANTLDMVSGEQAGAYLLSETGEEWVARGELPGRLRQLLVHPL